MATAAPAVPLTTVALRYRVPGSAENALETFVVEKEMLIKDMCGLFVQTLGKNPDSCDVLWHHPPKKFTAEELEKKVSAVLRRGDTLVIAQSSGGELKRGHTDGKYIPPIEIRNSIFVKHDVPGDNSCLFHSVGWIFDKPAAELRKFVAETVLANPDKYTDGFLGSPPRTYASWILLPSSWGGAIEIDLLCMSNQCEICVLDMTSKKPQVFGAGNGFTVRAFVVYTGNHYDGAGVGDSIDGGRGTLVKQFNSRDERPMKIAEDYLQGRVKAVAG